MRTNLRSFSLSLLATALIASISFGQSNPDYALTKSYMTTTAPTVDGVPEAGEWDDAGPWLVVNSENGLVGAHEGDTYGGDEDASFRFKTMWLEDSWETYFLFEVTDDIAAEEQPRDGRVWERDQIELFIDGTNLEGDEDLDSFVFWQGLASPETYGKFGVSRENLWEGNSRSMTDDPEVWADYDIDAPISSVSNTSDTGTNGNFYIEYGISLERMFDDFENFPFEDTPTEAAEHIVEDSTAVKFTVAYSDDDDIDFTDPVTDRAHTATYYRVEDSEWNDSTGFSDLVFTGKFEGIIETCTIPEGGILGDLDGDGEVAFADFLTLSGNFGKTGELTYQQGDIDCSGDVAFADFLTLSGNFGKTAAGAAAVPEPNSAVLLLIGFVAIVRRRGR